MKLALLFLIAASAWASSVTLTWTASTSAGVTGYKIYRGMVNGGPYALVGNNIVGNS